MYRSTLAYYYNRISIEDHFGFEGSGEMAKELVRLGSFLTTRVSEWFLGYYTRSVDRATPFELPSSHF